MAFVNLSGILTNSIGGIDVGATLKMTHLSTTGDTLSSTITELIIPPNGAYDIDLNFGIVRFDYTTEFTQVFLATTTINGDTTATTITELLNSVVEPTNAQLLLFQDILADAVTAETNAAASAAAALISENNASATAATLANNARAGSLMGINVRKPLNSWGVRAPINVLGDSISHGANAGELYYNGWTRILARMLSGDFGGLSYQGFVPFLTLDSGGPNESKDIHSVFVSGAWVSKSSESEAHGARAYNGLTFQSVTLNNYISTTIPTFQNKTLFWYLQQPGGGELTIRTNFDPGTDIVINTSGTLQNKAVVVANIDDEQGTCVVQAIKTDATANPVDIIGFGYIEDVETPTLHNFSQSGRRLRYVDEVVISDLTENASMFILALGHNDSGDVDANPAGAYALEFIQRIDWVIQYCNANDTLLIVPDFLWSVADNSFTRSELKRAATETSGIYIPLPNLIKTDRSIVDANYLINTINMWVDGSHPNEHGNKWIAETVAKYLGLSITSKKEAISTNDYWMPFDIPTVDGVKNRFTAPSSVSAYRINGEEVNFRVSVTGVSSPFPIGFYNLSPSWRVTPPFNNVGFSPDLAGYVNRSTSVLTSTFVVNLSGTVDLSVTATYLAQQEMFGKMPISLK